MNYDNSLLFLCCNPDARISGRFSSAGVFIDRLSELSRNEEMTSTLAFLRDFMLAVNCSTETDER